MNENNSLLKKKEDNNEHIRINGLLIIYLFIKIKLISWYT